MLRALIATIIVLATACAGPTEPARQPLDQYLPGTWELESTRGESVPGYLRSCSGFVCDSTCVAFGHVQFQTAGACIWTLAVEADTTQLQGEIAVTR